MPRQVGDKIKERIAFTFTPINLRDVQGAMISKEFPNIANLMNTALRFYFENRNKPSQIEDIKKWLVSEEGRSYIAQILNEVDAKK